MIEKCPGSGENQMLCWLPSDSSTDDYPGAVVCYECSFGVLVVRGSIHDAVSEAGTRGPAGKTRVHYITKSPSSEPVMAYRKGDLREVTT
jgi:hypothetical protein